MAKRVDSSGDRARLFPAFSQMAGRHELFERRRWQALARVLDLSPRQRLDDAIRGIDAEVCDHDCPHVVEIDRLAHRQQRPSSAGFRQNRSIITDADLVQVERNTTQLAMT